MDLERRCGIVLMVYILLQLKEFPEAWLARSSLCIYSESLLVRTSCWSDSFLTYSSVNPG
jgi:hypothetical protein